MIVAITATMIWIVAMFTVMLFLFVMKRLEHLAGPPLPAKMHRYRSLLPSQI